MAFACLYIFVCGGVYKYYSPAPDDTGVLLNAGAKFDLVLSGGSDACLLARRRVGTNPSLARRGRRYLSKTGAIVKINKRKSSSAVTVSPALASLWSHFLPEQEGRPQRRCSRPPRHQSSSPASVSPSVAVTSRSDVSLSPQPGRGVRKAPFINKHKVL